MFTILLLTVFSRSIYPGFRNKTNHNEFHLGFQPLYALRALSC